MKEKNVTPEEAMRQIQKIFKKRGIKALEMARKEILEEKIECEEAKEALSYFMTQYWHDLARPSLLSMVCEAVGGEPELTIPIAVPMILISGAMDVHDDIIDQSRTKDGHPTVYGKFGKDIALLVGDALLFKGFTLLNNAANQGISPEKMKSILEIIKDTFFELGEAEAMELQMRGKFDITPDEYLQVVRKKAADVEAHTRIGAIVGDGSKTEIEALGRYGRLLGMLIILRDDWIDMMDSNESRQRIKKEILPLPLLYALRNKEFKADDIQKKGKTTKEQAQKICEITLRGAAANQFMEVINKLAEQAINEMRKINRRATALELLTQAMIPTFSLEDGTF